MFRRVSGDAASYGRQRGQKKEETQVRTFTSAFWRVLIPFAVLALLAASGAVALTADQHVRSVTDFVIYDSRGKIVGKVLSMPEPDRALIAMKVDTRVLTFIAMRDGLIGTNATIGTPLLYETTDCSGQAFDAHNPDVLLFASWLYGAGFAMGALYLAVTRRV